MTDAERHLWLHLRARPLGAKFTRQFPIGNHVVDFACRGLKLAIECDGCQHSADTDAARTASIEAHGYRVIRFWNHDILGNTDGVLEAIMREIRLARNED
ncbi:endonuclease domain-containing protein [Qipengyuania sp.]|uniref:endonuclease domain-containing protein n=1 Tax=Qipengyuania sp. TaxID=2004515 RepID=UPI003AF51738